ncbi:MAG: hypothetical protein AB9866_25295 [Syntrophobacteraceae bacterium]
MDRRLKILLGIGMFCSTLSFTHIHELHAAKDNVVTPGDEVGVQFTCRLGNGQVASSSYSSVATEAGIPKSSIFIPRTTDDPVTLTAGEAAATLQGGKYMALEDAIILQLAKTVPGMRLGESRTVEIEANVQPSLGPRDRYVQLALVRQRSKQIRMTREEYANRTGREPKEGDAFSIDPAIPGKVVSLKDNEVLIHFFARSGSEVETPFGKGIIRETEKDYEIVIQVSKGVLVRSSGLVGRVTEINDRVFTVDFGHPFGGEKLMCDVAVTTLPSSHTAKKE